MKIRSKITFSFLTIIVVSSLLTGSLIFFSAKDNLENEIIIKIDLLLDDINAAIVTLLETQLANLQYLAQDPTVVSLSQKMTNTDGTISKQDQQDAYKQLKAHLTNFTDFYGGSGLKGGIYADAMVADLSGHMWIGTYGPDEGGNEAYTEWFRKGSQGLYLGSIQYNPTMHQTTQIAAVPIRDEKKNIIAVLQLETNVRAIIQILKLDFSDSGEVYIIGKNNTILTTSLFDPYGEISHKVDLNDIYERGSIKDKNQQVTQYTNYSGKYVVGITNHLDGHSGRIKDEQNADLIQKLDWLIIGEIETSEAFAPIMQLRNRIVFIILATAFMIILVSVYLARSISEPIRKLKEATMSSRDGLMNTKVDIQSEDEIGDLAKSFNHMIDSLLKTTVSRDLFSQEASERKHAEEGLRTSEQRLAIAQQIGQIGSWDWNIQDGTLIWSDETYRQFGLEPGQIAPTYENFGSFIHPSDRDFVNSAVKQTLDEDEPYSVEAQMVRADGTEWTMHAQGTTYRNDDGKPVRFIGIQQDITERKQAEEALKTSEYKYRTLFDQARDGIAVADTETGEIIACNNEIARMVGRDKSELIGNHQKILHPEENGRGTFSNTFKQHLEKDGAIIETQLVTKEGKLIPIEIKANSFEFDGKKYLQGLFRDITKRKESNKKLSNLAERLQDTVRKVITAQEEERRRIAQELHDEIGQALTVLMINLQNINHLSEVSAIRLALRKSLEMSEETIKLVRELSLNLRPSMLDDLGLVPAIRWFLDRQAKSGKIVCRLDADKIEEHYSPELEIVIFRVVQEGLTNIMRHAHARNVDVKLMQQDGQFNLWLRDDGDGFDISMLNKGIQPTMTLGLIGMEERVLLVGGKFQIKSTPGQGTEVHASIPLNLETASIKPS